MLRDCIGVFAFFAAITLAAGGTAIFHQEAGKGAQKMINVLIIAVIMMVLGPVFMVVPTAIVTEMWADPWLSAEGYMIGVVVYLTWAIGLIGMGISVHEGAIMLYHGRTYEEQKLHQEQTQAAARR